MSTRPLHVQRSPWLLVQQLNLGTGVDLDWWERTVSDGLLRAFVGEEEIGWHLSISFRDHRGNPSRYPSWDEIAHARYELLPTDRDFVMHLPPPSEYVAVHDTTFHLHEHPERVTPL